MSDSMVRSIVLKLEGLEDALKGVLEFAEATGELGQNELKALSQGMQEVSNMAGSLSSSLAEVPASLQQISDKAAEAQAMLKNMIAEDILSGGIGKISTENFLGNIPQELREAATQLHNYMTSNVVTENKKAEKSFEDLGKAAVQTAEAYDRKEYDESIRGLTSLEQATSDYVKASKELADAEREVDRLAQDSNAAVEDKIKAQERLTKAVEGANRAESRLDKESAKELERQAKAAEELAKAQVRLNQTMASSEFEKEIENLSTLEQASRRYTQALQEFEAAKSRAQTAKGSDDEALAIREQEEAYKKAIQARKQYNAEVAKEATQKNKERAKEVDELAKAEQRLTKAQEESRKAIPQAGRDSLKIAKEAEESATRELTAAEENLTRVLEDKSSTLPQVTAAVERNEKAQKNATDATRKALTAAGQYVDALPRLRYALYDVSRTLTRIGGGMLGVATSTGVVSTKMSRDFADVIRTTEAFRDTTGQTAQSIRRDFEDMYKAMPADWADITRIGEMAGQMNIASGDVAHFTELVTKFASSTDVSVDASATAFGRLSELLNVTSDEYENLGSSILQVGVNSVATESQIIEISQQIAGIAGTAGLTADQVVGLSSALASIGTAPELSRGIVTRFFTNLMNATSEGGERLEKFAAVSGMTADQFKQAWATDAAGAFQAVIKGLGQVEQSEAISVLRELGIQQVRDIPAVLKLAQNYELLGRSMDIAADGYREGSALGEHYGVIADEMSSKLHQLKNQFALLLDSLGAFTQTDWMKGLVDGVTRALELLTALANSPFGQFMAKLTVPVMGAVGALGLFLAALATMKASQLAAQTSMAGLGVAFNVFKNRGEAANLTLAQLNTRLKATGTYAKAAGTALKGIGVGLALTGITFAASKIAEHFQEATRMAERFAGLTDAIEADTKAYEEAVAAGEDVSDSYRTIDLAAQEGAQGVEELSDSMKQILGVSGKTAESMGKVADETDRATVALGDNFKMGVAQAIAEDEKLISRLQETDDMLAQAGFTAKEFATALVSNDGEGADVYLNRVRDAINQISEDQKDAFQADNPLMKGEVLAHHLAEIEDKARIARDTLEYFRSTASATGDSISEAAFKTEFMGAVLDGMGLSAEEIADAMDEAGRSVEGFRSVIEEFDTSAYDLHDTMWDLAETLIQNGNVWDEFSEEGRANVKALESALEDLWSMADGDAQAFAENVANAFAYVEGAGFNLTENVDILDQVLDNTFGTEWRAHLDTSQAHQSVKGYIDAVVAAMRARAQLERDAADNYMALARSSEDMSFANFYANQASNLYAVADGIDAQIASVQELGNQLSQVAVQGNKAGRVLRDRLGGGGGRNSGPKKAAKDTKDLKDELYTLINYASDLAGIWSRAFDIRFSGQKTIDAVTTSLRGIAERFREAENRVRDLRLQLQSLNGDLTGLQAELSKQQYFLSIATEYGDTARAEQINARIIELQAELAKKQAEVSDTNKELQKAQDATSRSLEGNSDAAIQNRSDLMDLVSQYQGHVKALAESGMSSKDLQRETDRLRKDFMDQAKQLGFSTSELKKYEQGFFDVKKAIDTVPRNITVKANTNPAMQAVNEWIASVNKKKASMNVNAKVSAPKSLGSISGGQYRPQSIYSTGPASVARLTSRDSSAIKIVVTGAGTPIGMRAVSTGGYMGMNDILYRASGGPAAWAKHFARGTDTIPAMLTPGEYVIQKPAVDFYGPRVMQMLNNMQIPKRFFTAQHDSGRASGGGGMGGRMSVDLTPSTVQAIAQAVQPFLVVNNKVIAQANGSDAQHATNAGRL